MQKGVVTLTGCSGAAGWNFVFYVLFLRQKEVRFARFRFELPMPVSVKGTENVNEAYASIYNAVKLYASATVSSVICDDNVLKSRLIRSNVQFLLNNVCI